MAAIAGKQLCWLRDQLAGMGRADYRYQAKRLHCGGVSIFDRFSRL